MTVGVFSAAAPPVRGYAEWIRQGALAPRDFSFADESYTVLGLFEHGGGLNLVLGRPLPHDFVLELGPRRYESSQSLEPVFVWAGRYWWPDTTLDWAAGEELTVSIILDPSSPATERAAAPPSAYLTELPAAHNGRDPFALKLVFDEPDLPLTAALLRDHALQVSGGSVLAVDQGRRAKDWLITLQPDGDGPLTVSLPSPADCADSGAVCAADGRMLRGRVTATIAGPPKLAALHVVGSDTQSRLQTRTPSCSRPRPVSNRSRSRPPPTTPEPSSRSARPTPTRNRPAIRSRWRPRARPRSNSS